ncbi:MAG: hypothetical protein CH6_0229 [Candidatus Kapaibacterium sp.]|nr:MAG: hypothetical protein CH6_0229 [Candidatus Kapabacteria bacterium]
MLNQEKLKSYIQSTIGFSMRFLDPQKFDFSLFEVKITPSEPFDIRYEFEIKTYSIFHIQGCILRFYYSEPKKDEEIEVYSNNIEISKEKALEFYFEALKLFTIPKCFNANILIELLKIKFLVDIIDWLDFKQFTQIFYYHACVLLGWIIDDKAFSVDEKSFALNVCQPLMTKLLPYLYDNDPSFDFSLRKLKEKGLKNITRAVYMLAKNRCKNDIKETYTTTRNFLNLYLPLMGFENFDPQTIDNYLSKINSELEDGKIKNENTVNQIKRAIRPHFSKFIKP